MDARLSVLGGVLGARALSVAWRGVELRDAHGINS